MVNYNPGDEWDRYCLKNEQILIANGFYDEDDEEDFEEEKPQ